MGLPGNPRIYRVQLVLWLVVRSQATPWFGFVVWGVEPSVLEGKWATTPMHRFGSNP